jgi:ribonuclease BN (tRNA processing enzyme)
MDKLVILGTAGAVTDGARDNVSFVLTCGACHVLFECSGSAAHKLSKIGIPYAQLEHVVITHTHLDHFYGLPGLIFSMRFRDRQRVAPLNIYCPKGSADDIRSVLGAFGLLDGKYFPLAFHDILLHENSDVLENDKFCITSTPVDHVPALPTLAMKIVLKTSNASVVYSSDTGPSESLVRLARNADLLLHECAGIARHAIPEYHSNALQVGEIAAKAGVKRLVLQHLDMVCHDEPEAILAEVRQAFSGDVKVAEDFEVYEV